MNFWLSSSLQVAGLILCQNQICDAGHATLFEEGDMLWTNEVLQDIERNLVSTRWRTLKYFLTMKEAAEIWWPTSKLIGKQPLLHT